MVVVEQVQLHVRACLCPALDSQRIDGCVAAPLKNLDGQVQAHVERIVAGRVGVELVVHRHQPPKTVVEHLEAIGAAPLIEPAIPEVAHAITAEIERRRQEHEPLDARHVR